MPKRLNKAVKDYQRLARYPYNFQDLINSLKKKELLFSDKSSVTKFTAIFRRDVIKLIQNLLGISVV